MKNYVLDENNEPVEEPDIMAWGQWFEHDSNRIVGSTNITSEIWVSTVFLGVDHNFAGKGSPILFETMVFGGALDERQWRYATYAEAKTHHDEIVALMRERYTNQRHRYKAQ